MSVCGPAQSHIAIAKNRRVTQIRLPYANKKWSQHTTCTKSQLRLHWSSPTLLISQPSARFLISSPFVNQLSSPPYIFISFLRMERVPLTRVIFEGRKTFWKTKNAINIIMVDHGLWDVIEIATFDPILMVESQRLYVNRKLLQEILCPLEPKTVFSLFNDTFERNAKEQLLVEFLFNSLIISEYLPVSKAFKILIKAGFLEHGVEAFVHHERPVNLIPFPEVSSTRYNTHIFLSPKWRKISYRFLLLLCLIFN